MRTRQASSIGSAEIVTTRHTLFVAVLAWWLVAQVTCAGCELVDPLVHKDSIQGYRCNESSELSDLGGVEAMTAIDISSPGGESSSHDDRLHVSGKTS